MPTTRDSTVSRLQRRALKQSARGVGERTYALSVRCVLSGVLGRSDRRWWYEGSAPASSSATAVRHHRRGDRLLRTMDDPLDLSAETMLEDTDDFHVSFAVVAHLEALRHWRKRTRGSRVQRRRRYAGSVAGRQPNTRRNFRSGLRASLRDSFGVTGQPPVYDEGDFERRFRVPRSVFFRIYNTVTDRPFLAQRINATGRLQAHPLQKVGAAFRVIAYGEATDRIDEYVRLSASTTAMKMRDLMRFIVDEFGPTYLRSPTPEEQQRILARNAERGLPGSISFLDCSH